MGTVQCAYLHFLFHFIFTFLLIPKEDCSGKLVAN